MKTRVDRFGRVVVPKTIRDRHGIGPGCEVEIEDSGENIVLRVLSDYPGLVEKDGILVFRGRAAGDMESVVRSLREDRFKKLGFGPG